MAVTIAVMKTFGQAVFELGLPDDGWDERQCLRGGLMLQGRSWAQFQQALGREIVWAEGDGWSWLGVVTEGRGVRYLHAPYGPTVRDAAALTTALTSLKSAAATLELDFVRCEPVGVGETVVAEAGMVGAKMMQPQHSLILDLTKSEDELRTALSSGHRNAINGADRRGLRFTLTQDPSSSQTFIQLMNQTASMRGFRAHEEDYYRVMLKTLMPLGAATVGLAEYDKKVMAAAIFLDDNQTRIYAHAGTDPEARKLQAAVPLVWEAVLEARAQGLKRFDLWGIAPDYAPDSHPWAGFTRFKRSFGGTEVSYAGTWELPIKRVKFKLYRLAKRLKG
jgi:hypothetical protein